MSGIIFNEDPNHYIFTRVRAGVKRVTKQMLVDFIDQYKDTNITDFLICLNASLTMYPSKRTQSALDKYREWEKAGKLIGKENDDVLNCTQLLCKMEEDGIEMHSVWIEELRRIGIRPWISIRMNDIHDSTNKDAFLPSEFTQSHPEYHRASHRGDTGYYDYALDYSHKEVREHYLTVISEALDTFDADGIELDFMREIYCAGIGREYETVKIMTEFFYDAVKLVRAAEKKYGHRILIGTRMPDTPEKALRLGFDVISWARSGNLDLLTITPRWTSADGDMPIDLWKTIISGTGTVLAAGLETLLDAYNRRGRKYSYNTLETALGFSCAYDFLGADKIYLFNYMDCPVIRDAENESIFMPENYKFFLQTAGNAEKETDAVRRHVLSFNDVYAVGCATRRPLPISFAEREGIPDYTAVRIPTGNIPEGRRVYFIIGTERGKGNTGEDYSIYANTVFCPYSGMCERKAPMYPDLDYFSYEIKNDGKLPPVTVAEVGIKKGEGKVHWIEIEVI